MKTPYTNDFLNQYTIENNPNLINYQGIGAGAGALGGMGLGALFANLIGAPIPVGLLTGAISGTGLGAVGGTLAGRNVAADARSRAFAQLSPKEQRAITEAFMNDMNASVQNVGIDGGFEQWYAQDPYGFQQFMLKNM